MTENNKNNLPLYGEQQILNQEQRESDSLRKRISNHTWEEFIDWCSANIFGANSRLRPEKQGLYPNLTDNTDWLNFRTSYFGFTEWSNLKKIPLLEAEKSWEQNIPANFVFGNPSTSGRTMSHSVYQDFKKIFDEWKGTLN